MAARIVELADALTADLAEAARGSRFARQFDPQRSYVPDDVKLTKADELRVDVVVGGHDESELLDRGTVGYTSRIKIGLRYKFSQGDSTPTGEIELSEIDDLVLLVEQIYEFLAKKRYCEATWRDSSIRATVVAEHLRTNNQFTGLLFVRFRVPAPLCAEEAT